MSTPRNKSFASYRRLTPTELKKIGLSPKSRHYVDTTKTRITKTTKTITARQYENLRAGVTKERATSERRTGERSYRTASAKENADFQARNRNLRNEFPGITLDDLRLIDKHKRVGWEVMTPDDKKRWSEMFGKYAATKHSRDAFLHGMGSPQVIHRRAA